MRSNAKPGFNMIGNQNADAAPLEVAHEILNVADRDRVDACERLVEEHE